MILQLLYEANTCLPCPASDMPAGLRNEIRLRLGGFVNVIENLENSFGAVSPPMESVRNNIRELVVVPRLPISVPLSSAS